MMKLMACVYFDEKHVARDDWASSLMEMDPLFQVGENMLFGFGFQFRKLFGLGLVLCFGLWVLLNCY